jgi:DNA-binding transcriptional MerR regulator
MLTISALSRRTGVSSKTLRYWESIGLLPRAQRNYNGYRLFPPEAARYVQFVQKAKSVGLTLAQMRRVLAVAHRGKSPCLDVLDWIDRKSRAVAQELRSLRQLQRRLAQFRRTGTKMSSAGCARENELCCLIEDLPNVKSEKGAEHDEKAIRHGARAAGHSGG